MSSTTGVKPSAREYARVIHKNRFFRSRIESFNRSASRVGSLATRRRRKKKSHSIRFQWHWCSMYLYEYIDIPSEHFQLSKPNKCRWSVDLFHSSLVMNPLEIFRSMLSMTIGLVKDQHLDYYYCLIKGKEQQQKKRWNLRSTPVWFLFAKATKMNTKMMKSSLRKIAFRSFDGLTFPWFIRESDFPCSLLLSSRSLYFHLLLQL